MEFSEPGTELTSETVSSAMAPHITWTLTVCPNGKRACFRGHVSVFLNYTNSSKTENKEVRAKFHVYIPMTVFNRDIVGSTSQLFTPAKPSWGSDEGRPHKVVKPALGKDGSLLIKADVKYVAATSPSFNAFTVDECAMMQRCREAFDRMLLLEEGADCTVVVGLLSCDFVFQKTEDNWSELQVKDRSFKAHRLILSARSPVFAAMLCPSTGFDEAAKGQLIIEDTTPEAVKEMLQYIYTGKVDWPSDTKHLPTLQEAVLKLADKYALLDLKAHVEGLLADAIDSESFFHFVHLADDHSCEGLKKACALYFAGNRAAIVQKAEWKRLRGERSELAALLLEAAAIRVGGK